MSGRLLIAGCGDLGLRLAERLARRTDDDSHEHWQVTGLRRSIEGLSKRLGSRLTPIAADLTDPDTLRDVPADWDAILYTATPGTREEAQYRGIYIDGLRHLLDRVRAQRLIFVSSTAVYGQSHGEWVDEDAETTPNRFNGEVLLQAEEMARAAGGVVVRFSGIYGPGRQALIQRVRSGGVRCRREPPIWTNRIHADDCAAALEHVLDLPDPDDVYLASDDVPAPRWDVLQWLAERLGAAAPIAAPDDGSGQGKRVCAARLKASGFAVQYPDYRAGYEALLTCS